MLSNFFDLFELSTANVEKDAFADAELINDWAKAAVDRLHKSGIVNGKEDNMFDPQGDATRAEIAQIVYNSNLASIINKEDTDAGTSETEPVDQPETAQEIINENNV